MASALRSSVTLRVFAMAEGDSEIEKNEYTLDRDTYILAIRAFSSKRPKAGARIIGEATRFAAGGSARLYRI